MKEREGDMPYEEQMNRINEAARLAVGARECVGKSLEELISLPDIDWENINRAARAASLALRALFNIYAAEIGKRVVSKNGNHKMHERLMSDLS